MTAPQPVQQRPGSRERLTLQAVGDLVDAYEPDVLAVMQADATALAAAGGPAAAIWLCFATALGEASAIAEFERQDRS